jgi:hypothetical protein
MRAHIAPFSGRIDILDVSTVTGANRQVEFDPIEP